VGIRKEAFQHLPLTTSTFLSLNAKGEGKKGGEGGSNVLAISDRGRGRKKEAKALVWWGPPASACFPPCRFAGKGRKSRTGSPAVIVHAGRGGEEGKEKKDRSINSFPHFLSIRPGKKKEKGPTGSSSFSTFAPPGVGKKEKERGGRGQVLLHFVL